MARYIICGPPPAAESPPTSPRKSLSVRKDQRRASNLRTLYRDSGETIVPIRHDEQAEPLYDHRVSSPTTPRLPPTPPTVDEEEQSVKQSPEEHASIPQNDGIGLRSIPATPVNGHSPPTPDDTPPREHLRLPVRPFLNLRPSIASTRAESFRTAREQIHSDDESIRASPDFFPSFGTAPPVPELPMLSSIPVVNHEEEPSESTSKTHRNDSERDELPSSPILPIPHGSQVNKSVEEEVNTPETRFMFSNNPSGHEVDVTDRSFEAQTEMEPSIHAQVTTTPETALMREKSLRDRLAESNKLRTSASTEAFANVIGWNDGALSKSTHEAPTEPEESSTNRWSGQSNLSAVEAFVVDSPIKPKKRGTLRKVVKNDSLRSVSSPVPKSNRNSLQSTSDSPHRLVHKTQKLGNQNRWSTGSDISRRSLSWGSNPTVSKQEIIKVAVIPERNSSMNTSSSGSRRHSRSVSTNSGMPPVTPVGPRRKRAFSDSQPPSATAGAPQIPMRSSSLSAPTSRSGSRSNSIGSHQVSIQREQAEKDLRSTLDRMESERLSASLRRSSDQSVPSPSPAPRDQSHVRQSLEHATQDQDVEDVSRFEKPRLSQRPNSINIINITPGTKEWADLRPSELVGTPFSQASALSTSPEIIEARIINFFPHNNESVQLIEPNRLSETAAVKALKAQNIRRANTIPERQVKISTSTEGETALTNGDFLVSSPLRNPRKPPEPPQVQFAVIPPTPKNEPNKQIDVLVDSNVRKGATGAILQQRPLLQTNERSESFIRTLSRGFSLRNAKNLKADQELDSALHPFWRPRAFWDEEELKRRSQIEKYDGEALISANTEGGNDTSVSKSIAILDPTQPLVRSNSIGTGPMSLVRKFSERRKQRRIVDDHLAQQQALVKQTSYSSLHRIRAGHRLFGLQPLRSLSLNTRNVNLTRLNSLRDRMSTARARRENDKRELRREKLRKSIGTEVLSQGDSRFPAVDIGPPMIIEHFGGRKIDDQTAINEMLENARAENVVEKRGLRM